MTGLGYKMDLGITVFDIPESMELGYLAKETPFSRGGLAFASTLVAEIEERLARGDRKFVIDLSRLRYLDSAGLGIILGCRAAIVKAGGEVRAVTPVQRIHELFSVHRIDTVLPLDQSIDAALTLLGSHPAKVC